MEKSSYRFVDVLLVLCTWCDLLHQVDEERFTFNGIINATVVAVVGYRVFHGISKSRGTSAA